MNKLVVFFSGFFLIGFSSCDKHEVIPAPPFKADLNCSCKVIIDGNSYEYNDTCKYSNEKNIVTNGTSAASYTTIIQNEDMTQGLEVKMKTLEWSDDGSSFPNIEEWKAYFTNSTQPDYHINDVTSIHGVVVKWTDSLGVEWTSDTTVASCPILRFVYSAMEHDSDGTGDYMKFKAVFDCPLHDGNGNVLCLENGILKTAFRRK